MNDCTCCNGTGEHRDGHECYVCDASGTAEAQGSPENVCEGHHGTPDDGPENAKERYGPGFEHYSAQLNVMRAAAFAGDGYEGVTHAGLAIVAADSGLVLMAQRAFDETDAPEVQETWEFPGGGLEPGEEPLAAAFREFAQEVGCPLPEGVVVNGWRAGPTDNYQGFVYQIEAESDISGFVPNDEVQNLVWFDYKNPDGITLRPEMADFDWTLLNAEPVSGNTPDEGDDMDEELAAEPDLTMADLMDEPLMVHGVMAPEDAESGDARGFNDGAMTRRPYRLPFRWQESDIGAHAGAVTVGSVDRLMRKDGLIHWEGSLMSSESAGKFTELLAFFGRYGVSVDGDRGSLDQKKTQTSGVTWFDAVRAAGLTAVDIPAFSEAYVAFGPHPDMPDMDDAETEVLTSSGQMVSFAETFDRGPGWVTNPRETKRIHDYWTKKGQPGYAKIRWGTRGDFTRAKKLIGEKIGANSPEDLRYLNQIIARWHHDALGYWPGDWDKPGNATTAEGRAKRKASASAEPAWEVVLTSSAGIRALPPASYFDRHPDSGALVIEDPDENGIIRTYGYAGEWGVCHIGHDGRCVELPEDPTGEYDDFHLGRMRTAEGYLNTGLITYKVEHRNAKRILTETATQAHFDNIATAWAAVRLGEDDRGVWFSGVVLPHVPEEDLVLIEASGQVSGEWKYGALRGLQCVNIPGFPVMRASAEFDDEGNVIALAASAFDTGECEPTPKDRMEALAKVDAEVRFGGLRAAWAYKMGG